MRDDQPYRRRGGRPSRSANRMASVADEILAARKCGVVHCGVIARGNVDVLQLGKQFGLRPDPFAFAVQLREPEALRLITSILHKDLAYQHPIMPEPRARDLAQRFLSQFGDRPRYFSNGWPGVSSPATDATLDTGVLVVGEERSGCLWVEDED